MFSGIPSFTPTTTPSATAQGWADYNRSVCDRCARTVDRQFLRVVANFKAKPMSDRRGSFSGFVERQPEVDRQMESGADLEFFGSAVRRHSRANHAACQFISVIGGKLLLLRVAACQLDSGDDTIGPAVICDVKLIAKM